MYNGLRLELCLTVTMMSRITIALKRFARSGTLNSEHYQAPRRRHRTPSTTTFSTRMRRIKNKRRQQVDDSRGNNNENGDNSHIRRPSRAMTKRVLGRDRDLPAGIDTSFFAMVTRVEYGEQTTGGSGRGFSGDGSSSPASGSGFAEHAQRDLKAPIEDIECGDVEDNADGKWYDVGGNDTKISDMFTHDEDNDDGEGYDHDRQRRRKGDVEYGER
jgi:hypothetical protein